ncbi:hypothetical protein [Kitasatospora sp. NPDC094015]|uniref:effector-associated constant component EACC1 n=1 Tax=Kitasatospora sp. NPDC094015 TaxID=3155205 RepID=UPI003328A140
MHQRDVPDEVASAMDGVLGSADLAVAVVGVSRAEQDAAADELTESLAERAPALVATRVKPDGLTQDAGTVLAVVLGSSSVTALATGLASWLRRRSEFRLVLKRRRRNGETVEVTLQGRPDEHTERMVTDFLEG